MTITDAGPPASCKVYTPSLLASAIVRSVGDGPGIKWLEPSVGHGAFLTALRQLGVGHNRIWAVDLDPVRCDNDSLAATLRGVDFLKWAARTPLRFDRIVGNPPYVSLRRVHPTIRSAALETETPFGRPMSAGANIWFAFLCASLRILKGGGALGFVLPASWEYASYARELREAFARNFTNLEVHRSKRPLFPNVQDGSVVILADGYKAGTSQWYRYEHLDRQRLIKHLSKCKQSPSHALPIAPSEPCPLSTRRLGDVLHLRLGGVTGDADYFLLTEDDRIRHKLPIKTLIPIVSKARHLVGSELSDADWNRLRSGGERIWLFNPPPRFIRHPAVRKYLRLPKTSGGCDRSSFKVKNRKPWYKTPLPRGCHGFLSGMSPFGPWICMRAMHSLNATNTLYTVHFRGKIGVEERFAWAISLLSTPSRAALKQVVRVYPDGLRKFEPGDLMSVRVAVPATAKGARGAYRRIIRAMRAGSTEDAHALADRWMKKSKAAQKG